MFILRRKADNLIKERSRWRNENAWTDNEQRYRIFSRRSDASQAVWIRLERDRVPYVHNFWEQSAEVKAAYNKAKRQAKLKYRKGRKALFDTLYEIIPVKVVIDQKVEIIG